MRSLHQRGCTNPYYKEHSLSQFIWSLCKGGREALARKYDASEDSCAKKGAIFVFRRWTGSWGGGFYNPWQFSISIMPRLPLPAPPIRETGCVSCQLSCSIPCCVSCCISYCKSYCVSSFVSVSCNVFWHIACHGTCHYQYPSVFHFACLAECHLNIEREKK